MQTLDGGGGGGSLTDPVSIPAALKGSVFVPGSLTFVVVASDPGDGLGCVSAKLTDNPALLANRAWANTTRLSGASGVRADTLGR